MIQPLWETLPREDNLTIETVRTSKKYRQTNPIWNHEGFNHRKQIGSLTYLYKKGECDFIRNLLSSKRERNVGASIKRWHL